MDQHQYQHDAQPPSGRRKFLRQLGTTAVATAALSGLADIVGLKPAAAATRAEGDMKVRGARKHASRERRAVTSVELTCYLCSGCCGSPCTPTGVYCHHCTGVTWLTGDIGVIAFAGYYCLGGNNNFTLT